MFYTAKVTIYVDNWLAVNDNFMIFDMVAILMQCLLCKYKWK